MLARDALRQAVKTTLAPALRAQGFRGTYPTWRLQREGDVVLVNLFGNKFNEGPYGDFALSIGVVPAAWWAWSHECAQGDILFESESRPGKEQPWDCLYSTAVRPRGRREQWPVDANQDVTGVGEAMTAAALRALPAVLELTGPGQLAAAIQAGKAALTGASSAISGGPEMSLAVLLSDIGGAELVAACTTLESVAEHSTSPMPRRTLPWVRRRAGLDDAS
ncbi:DUF4304 domain-containing protein [Phycicoccus avicenniae]|uniref:DUF4304 domain-containing protein n=1 Tax=Phycicoccus avicenniae TaxID=2828860 RepID=UPI003D2D9D47